jgi:pimeloyl-ACP methyl ester carboxylesterase
MATFVLVHGGWGGGWEWTPVADALRQRGHEVFTPTLTGLGEREHIRASEVTLADHIDDVVGVIHFEDIDDVVLCGHSYGGMVVTGVADRRPERIRLLTYLDAFVPRDGESLRDVTPPGLIDALLAVGRDRGDGRAPIPDELLPPDDARNEATERYVARLRPQATNTFTERIALTGAVDRLPRAYVHCTGYEDSVMGPFADRARSEGWLYRDIHTQHDLHLSDPDGTVEVLDDLAHANLATGASRPNASSARHGTRAR